MSGTENNAPARKRPRKRWWFAWLVIGVLGGIALNIFQPRFYQAHTNILIIPQRVPVSMVTPTVTADLNERLNMITQQILSRTRLERIIQEFNLYEPERREQIMEDVIEQMRRDINVNVSARPDGDKGARSFSVSFTSPDARTAMRVTERLASLFVQENLEDRELLADQTDQFLQGQIEDTRRRLFESQMHVREARRRGFEFAPLTAEHEVLVETYKQLLRHREASKLALRLEQRQIGEQFKIIDGARLPEAPVSPRTFPYLALGALGGLATGLMLSLLAARWRRRRIAPTAA
jgi:uncharacterized protein involved in exopolysaccharide biosynthesis